MQLYTYQEDGVEFITENERIILGDDMGTGKTAMSISSWPARKNSRILVICPESMKGLKAADGHHIGGWAGEVEKWAPQFKVQIVRGGRDEREAQLKADANVFIVNYEVLASRKAKGEADKLLCGLAAVLGDMRWDVIVFDEAHRLKSRDAKVTKAAKELCASAPRVQLLTGTPIMNRVSELYTLLNMLYPRDRRFTSYWRFCETYAIVKKGMYGWEVYDHNNPNHPAIQALRKQLSNILIRRTKADVLKDMPAKTVQKVWVELTGSQRRIYDEMEKSMLTQLDSGQVISVTMALAQITRLKQIAVDPDMMTPENVGPLTGAKVNALMDIVDSINGKPFVVFSQFKQAIDRLAKLFDEKGISYRLITGDVTGEDRSRAVDDFQNGRVKAVLATIQAGGLGLTLTKASTAIFLDKMWTPALNVQAQDRLHRVGQTEPVTIYELLADESVEERIERLLYDKLVVTSFLDNNAELTPEQEAAAAQNALKLNGRRLLEVLFEKNV